MNTIIKKLKAELGIELIMLSNLQFCVSNILLASHVFLGINTYGLYKYLFCIFITATIVYYKAIEMCDYAAINVIFSF